MFRNRHLNFGYLLVILAVFAIAISASSKLAYASGGENGTLVMSFDAKEGTVIGSVGVPPTGSGGVIIPVPGKPEKIPPHIKKVTPCIIITHTGSHCITFIIAGYIYIKTLQKINVINLFVMQLFYLRKSVVIITIMIVM